MPKFKNRFSHTWVVTSPFQLDPDPAPDSYSDYARAQSVTWYVGHVMRQYKSPNFVNIKFCPLFAISPNLMVAKLCRYTVFHPFHQLQPSCLIYSKDKGWLQTIRTCTVHTDNCLHRTYYMYDRSWRQLSLGPLSPPLLSPLVSTGRFSRLVHCTYMYIHMWIKLVCNCSGHVQEASRLLLRQEERRQESKSTVQLAILRWPWSAPTIRLFQFLIGDSPKRLA